MSRGFNEGFLRAIKEKKGGSNVKSIQKGTYTGNFASADITINEVVPENCVVILSYKATSYDGQVDPRTEPRGRLTTATNLNLQRFAAAVDITVEWQVIEFQNVKSIQRGFFDVGGSVYSITISSVNLLKTFFYFTKYHASTTYGDSKALVSGKLTSETNVSFSAVASTNLAAAWFVVEFY